VSVFGVKLPDVGEGVAEAELIAWHVSVGDHVHAEALLAEVLTDKATVEISSPVTGVVTFLHGDPGDAIAVGTELVGIELEPGVTQAGDEPASDTVVAATAAPAEEVEAPPAPAAVPAPAPPPAPAPASTTRALAAPAVRARAAALGIDLRSVTGSGENGRVLHSDLDRQITNSTAGAATRHVAPVAPRSEPVLGLRRRIAERLSTAWREIPHITYVEAIDATELEVLRASLNRQTRADGLRLTILPFLLRAVVLACGEQPRTNAHFDAEASTLSVFDAVHVGIATQTPDGLKVPVVHNAQSLGLWASAAAIGTVSAAARDGSATREQLVGSTITITSLGALGGIVTTPIINQPEVAIIGVNKLETRPVWRNNAFEPRQMFNLSSSFDHRIIDGWDAATFVQRIKTLLETPALLFIDES
jgi:2-oxoisovalerate dehydrogenase E2 component (dihydrolipoyl transacylase)